MDFHQKMGKRTGSSFFFYFELDFRTQYNMNLSMTKQILLYSFFSYFISTKSIQYRHRSECTLFRLSSVYKCE
mgnify:CR=1 FL=1